MCLKKKKMLCMHNIGKRKHEHELKTKQSNAWVERQHETNRKRIVHNTRQNIKKSIPTRYMSCGCLLLAVWWYYYSLLLFLLLLLLLLIPLEMWCHDLCLLIWSCRGRHFFFLSFINHLFQIFTSLLRNFIFDFSMCRILQIISSNSCA